jgi:hypothetical protein
MFLDTIFAINIVRLSNTGKKINIFVGFRRQYKDNRALFEIEESW